VNQLIALNLESDFDICRYRLACKSTLAAVDEDGWSFWRRRFRASFEPPSWTDRGNFVYKRAYQKRRKALMYGAKFESAVGRKKPVPDEVRKGTLALEVLRDLIKDDADGDMVYESVNLAHLENFTNNHDLLNVVLFGVCRVLSDAAGLPKPLLQAVQVVLSPFLFRLDRHLQHYSFPDSQQVVYATAETSEIFGGLHGLEIDMEWVLHHINFWKYHMVREAECTLFEAFSELDVEDRPRLWDQKLKQGGNKLGVHWKGSYAYVERNVIQRIRKGQGHKSQIPDEFAGDSQTACFQDMRLDLVDDSIWPPLFEEHLHSLAPPENRLKTRAQHRTTVTRSLAPFKPINFQFSGEGHDSTEAFRARGWLNALPPQQGIPGWQRMTMMKYFEDPDTGTIDEDAMWAYEGVVLPGGQIIIGRWWSPGDGRGEHMYSGPFILWCVDGPRYAGDATSQVDDDDLP
ncbi:hypothetical protein BAUCODRAFT_61254, partial [Baudoinia panamericana UAMH 10762]